jgi:hypothetical protein
MALGPGAKSILKQGTIDRTRELGLPKRGERLEFGYSIYLFIAGTWSYSLFHVVHSPDSGTDEQLRIIQQNDPIGDIYGSLIFTEHCKDQPVDKSTV